MAWRITNLPEKMSAIVKEYSCTPMEPIRIQRRLVQSSSLPLYLSISLSLSPLPLLSRWWIGCWRRGGRWSVGWSSNIPFIRPFLPLFGRWFPIYKTSLLYERQRYVPTRAPILFRLRALHVTLPKYERRHECLLLVLAPLLRPLRTDIALHRAP